jgi:hypothetical protein
MRAALADYIQLFLRMASLGAWLTFATALTGISDAPKSFQFKNVPRLNATSVFDRPQSALNGVDNKLLHAHLLLLSGGCQAKLIIGAELDIHESNPESLFGLFAAGLHLLAEVPRENRTKTQRLQG